MKLFFFSVIKYVVDVQLRENERDSNEDIKL